MEQLGNLAGSFSGSRTVNWGSVFKTSELSPRTQVHLSKVYGTLAIALVASVIGVIADINYHLGGTLSSIGCILLMIVLGMNRDPEQWQQRIGYLSLYGFLQGCSIGPLVNLALRIDPAIVMTAFLGTATIFVCFSLTAIYSPRRSYLYLGGMISSAMMFLCLLSFMSIFYRPMWAWSIQLYFGLAVFCAYVIFDTQMIIEKAEAGSVDFVWDALELFIDFIAIFVRILIILIQNSQSKEEKKKSRR